METKLEDCEQLVRIEYAGQSRKKGYKHKFSVRFISSNIISSNHRNIRNVLSYFDSDNVPLDDIKISAISPKQAYFHLSSDAGENVVDLVDGVDTILTELNKATVAYIRDKLNFERKFKER